MSVVKAPRRESNGRNSMEVELADKILNVETMNKQIEFLYEEFE